MENIHVLINSFSFNLKVIVTKYEMLCYKVVLSKYGEGGRMKLSRRREKMMFSITACR